MSPGAIQDLAKVAEIIVGNGVTEIRALDGRLVRSGYFDNPDAFVEAAVEADAREPTGVHFTLNELHPALMARSDNRIVDRPPHTTSDADVRRYRWLYIDCDPVRPSGISSTDAEHEAAIERARKIAAWLEAFGWPTNAFVVADSGNGAHLLVRIDLPADADGRRLVSGCLDAISLVWTDSAVVINTSVANPSRICRLYGTTARKGDSSPGRPHRASCILQAPAEDPAVVPEELLLALVEKVPVDSPDQRGRGKGGSIDVPAYLSQHGLAVSREGPWKSGRKWVLKVCPWSSDHVDDSAYVVQFPSGAVAAGCQHNGCAGKKWPDLRDVVEGGREGASLPDAEPGRRRARLVCVADVEPEEIEWLWHSRLARGKITLLAGDPGSGKTFLALAVAAALSKGDALIGDQAGRDPTSIVYLTREDGVADTLRPRLDAMGADLTRVHVLVGASDNESVNLADLSVVEDAIERSGASLIVVDPVQSWLGAGVDAHRANETRPILDALAEICARHGCACLIIAHMAKAVAARAVTAALGSIDFAGAARVMLIAGANPGSPDNTVLAAAKSNIGPMPTSIEYRVDRERGGFEWIGESEVTASELLAKGDRAQRGGGALGVAMEFLRQQLGSGARPATQVQQLAVDFGISPSTLRRAREELNVQIRRSGFGPGGISLWGLPITMDDMDVQPEWLGNYDAHGGISLDEDIETGVI